MAASMGGIPPNVMLRSGTQRSSITKSRSATRNRDRSDVRRKHSTGSSSLLLKKSALLEAEIQFPTHPGIRGGVDELVLGKFGAAPIRGARSLRDAKAKEQSCQIAHARLFDALASHR